MWFPKSDTDCLKALDITMEFWQTSFIVFYFRVVVHVSWCVGLHPSRPSRLSTVHRPVGLESHFHPIMARLYKWLPPGQQVKVCVSSTRTWVPHQTYNGVHAILQGSLFGNLWSGYVVDHYTISVQLNLCILSSCWWVILSAELGFQPLDSPMADGHWRPHMY